MIPKRAAQEVVLYYTPDRHGNDVKLKGVLVRMGIRIRNISPDQIQETVGALAGVPGFSLSEGEGQGLQEPVIPEPMLVMHRFTSRRVDELLLNLRKAGVPKINLKAVVTPSNCSWSFFHLYEEIRQEHEKMNPPAGGPEE